MPYLYSVSDNPRKITKSLDQFISHIDSMPGHNHLYDEFDSIMASIKLFRENNSALPSVLAYSMRSAVTCLVHENMEGRRPWNGEWETYFSKCMSNAHRLTKEMSLFDTYMHFCPPGYCNQFLDAFMHMDGHMRAVEEHVPIWGFRFEAMAALAAEMFFLTADSSALVMEKLLDHPDDRVFTWLLSGFSKSASPKIDQILMNFMNDDEEWVRTLAKELINKRRDSGVTVS